MADPEHFDDPGPLAPQPPNRARRAATVVILVLLIVSMVFLAFASGGGFVRPASPDQPDPTVSEAGESARPAGSPDARLAIVDGSGRLLTADAAGHLSAPLGDPGVTYSFPAWSPEGDRIAVIGDDAGTGAVHVFGIGAAGAAPAGPADVYDSAERAPFYLYWSPDGRRVSFLTREPDGIALRIGPADASAPAEVVREGEPMYWAWADASRVLVHSGGSAPDAFIGEVGLDGVASEPGVTGPGRFRAPATTADGASRAYVTQGDRTAGRVIVEARDGSGQHAVDVAGDAALGFSPASTDLAFIAPVVADARASLPLGPLRVVSATTGDVRVLLDDLVVAFFWAPDGRTIAVLEVGQSPDDSVATRDRAPVARLARAPIAAPAGGVGVRLAFIDAASGAVRSQHDIRIGDVFVAQVLPYFDQYALSHRIWSADSRAIALPVAGDDGTTGISIIPADGSDPTRIADGVAASWSP